MNRPLLASMALLGAALPAWAAPTFVAEQAHDVEVAAAAWQAGVACTGREGTAHPTIEIVERTIPGDYLGVADTGDDGRLRRIELNAPPERRDEVIAHEVAHAWINEGPTALVEGAAELLADCMVAQRPGLAPLQYDDGRDLVALGDLRTWAPPDERGPAALDGVRTDAYLGAARLLRTAALLVDPVELWAERELDWQTFDALLTESDGGEPLLEALREGVEAQREALADPDLDGLTAVAEALLGTDPDLFDSDADGWWDGALQVPEGAVALPMDGTPVCTGLAAPRAGATVTAVTGGNLRGRSAPVAAIRSATRSGSDTPDEGAMPVPGGVPILAQLSGPASGTSGGAWARVQGDGLVPSSGCVSTASVTVWAHDPGMAPAVDTVERLVQQALDRAEARFGPGPGRLAIALGGTTTTYEDGIAWFSTAEVKRAHARGELEHLAHLAVSLRHLWATGERDWSAAEGLARSLVSDDATP